MANPSQLPDDIIHLFVERLPSVEDFVRSGAVCKSWQSVVEIRKNLHQQQKIPSFSPWLMLNTYDYDNDQQEQPIQPFFSLSSQTPFNLQLPQTQSKRCWGSPFGWLVTYGIDLNISLLNPLSRVQLSLPSQPTFQYQYKSFIEPKELREDFVLKFVLTSNPTFLSSNQPCIVMAIYSEYRELAFAKPGDEAWTPVESPYHPCYQDAIFFNGQFYAVTDDGELLVCEINTARPTATDLASPRDGSDDVDRFYLIEMFGNLHMVERTFFWKDPDSVEIQNRTEVLEVYRFDFGTKTWTKVLDLGDYALFIGNGTSFAISSSDYPVIKRNCIYFVDDHSWFDCNHFSDMGVYDMKEGTVEPIYFGNGVLSTLYRPLFVMPSL